MVAKFAAIAMAASAASTAVSFMGNMAAASNAQRIGAANAQLAERDAQVAENNRIALGQKLELDLERADDNFRGLQSQTHTAYIYRGVDPSDGTPLDVMLNNVSGFEHDKQILEYNTKIAQQEQTELAAFSRMKGDLARLTGGQRATAYRPQAGTSLLGGATRGATLAVFDLHPQLRTTLAHAGAPCEASPYVL